MKTRSVILLSFATSVAGIIASGCFQPPSEDMRKLHRGNDVPIVFVTTPDSLRSRTFTVDFSLYDEDSDSVILWDVCPFPGAPPEYGGAPILRIGFSDDGGSTFSPIDPADLMIDGEPIVVPSCGDVSSFDSSIRYTANSTSNGEPHVLTWDSLTYIPEASPETVIRIAVTDGSFTSDPGDTDPFPVANAPGFSLDLAGSRPGDVLSVELAGLLTNWGVTTTTGAVMENVSLTNLAFTSTTSGTATLTHGADTDQVPRDLTLLTPGAGVPSGDEIAKGTHWTCAALGTEVEEYEDPEAERLQHVCDWGNDWGIAGFLTAGDSDFYEFIANSSGTVSFSLDWDSADTGDVTDYDAFVYDPDVGLAACADSFVGCTCADVSKPEDCTLTGLTPGNNYIVYISHYAGEETTYTVTIGAGP